MCYHSVTHPNCQDIQFLHLLLVDHTQLFRLLDTISLISLSAV